MYIHLNPVKAGLVSKAEAYRWSSVRLYCDEDAPQAFVDHRFVLNVLAPNWEGAKDIYRDLLNRGKQVETEQVFEQEDVIDRFRSSLAGLFPALFRRMISRNRTMEGAGLELLSTEALDERIDNLKDNFFTRDPETRLAKKFLVEQLISRGYKRGEIAERLGVSRKTVYNILKKG